MSLRGTAVARKSVDEQQIVFLGKKKGVWAVASASPVQPSADTRDDQRMLACPVAVISSR